jgi:hypothetical protein
LKPTQNSPHRTDAIQPSLGASDKGSRFDPMLALTVIATWVAVVPLLVPDRLFDRGIFVSVAARLLAGDILYSEVYDNKEPLFFYFVAGQLALGPWAELGAEAMLIAMAAAGTYFIAVKVASRWTATAVSFIAAPLILTGSFYAPGFTHLPATSLVLAASAACAYGRPVLAGTCIGVLLFAKPILMPVALVAVACFLVARWRLSEALAFAISASVTSLIVVALLVGRGEFWPFMEAIKLNVAYSQGSLIGDKTGLASLAAHIKLIAAGGLFVDEMTAIALATMLMLIALSPIHQRSREQIAIAAACLLTVLSSLVVLSLTGLWLHHNQILYIPAIFGALGLTPLLDLAIKRARLPTVGVVVLMGYLLAGTPGWRHYVQSFPTFIRSYAALGELSPEARHLLATAPSGAYARFGSNDELGHAFGLGQWKLVCARFHQYAFEPAAVLDKVFECASKAPSLIVGANFEPDFRESAGSAWNDFVARVERLLAQNYSCDGSFGLRACRRVGNYSELPEPAESEPNRLR